MSFSVNWDELRSIFPLSLLLPLGPCWPKNAPPEHRIARAGKVHWSSKFKRLSENAQDFVKARLPPFFRSQQAGFQWFFPGCSSLGWSLVAGLSILWSLREKRVCVCCWLSNQGIGSATHGPQGTQITFTRLAYIPGLARFFFQNLFELIATGLRVESCWIQNANYVGRFGWLDLWIFFGRNSQILLMAGLCCFNVQINVLSLMSRSDLAWFTVERSTSIHQSIRMILHDT